MGHRELLRALRRKGEEQADAIRLAANGKEKSLLSEFAARRDELRAAHELRRATACAERHHDIMAEAEREVAIVRLRAEHELALLLRERAGTCLEGLRAGEYESLFRQLAEELPPGEWGTIRVSPLDADLAATLFPRVEIVVDPAITGGVVAVTADASLTVLNTLESRLEKGWPDLLPHLVDELRGRLP